MPSTINGIGTSYCGYGAPINWSGPEGGSPTADHDAMESVVIVFFPILPYRAVHTFSWDGQHCQVINIRTTPQLMLCTYLRPIALFLVGTALLAIPILGTITWISESSDRYHDDLWAIWAGLIAMLGLGIGLLKLQNMLTRRTRDIRLVIGPGDTGSCDPALWSRDVLDAAPSTEEMFGTPDANAASEKALSEGRFSKAMFAARIAVARGNPQGEVTTDRILSSSEVSRVLPELRKEPWLHSRLLPS